MKLPARPSIQSLSMRLRSSSLRSIAIGSAPLSISRVDDGWSLQGVGRSLARCRKTSHRGRTTWCVRSFTLPSAATSVLTIGQLELLPHLTPTSFPALERLVFRRPGLIDWPGFTTETTIAPHPDLRRFFNVAFAQLPTLLHGAQLLRCTSLRKRAVPTTAASTNGDATAVEVPVEEDEQVLHEELEHSGGVTTAAWWTWSRRAEGSKGRDVAVPRRVTSLAAGMQRAIAFAPHDMIVSLTSMHRLCY